MKSKKKGLSNDDDEDEMMIIIIEFISITVVTIVYRQTVTVATFRRACIQARLKDDDRHSVDEISARLYARLYARLTRVENARNRKNIAIYSNVFATCW